MKIILFGLPGAGKSTIGKLLSQHLNLSFFDMDDHIPEIFKQYNRRGELVPRNRVIPYAEKFGKKISKLNNVVICASPIKNETFLQIHKNNENAHYIELRISYDTGLNRTKQRKKHFFSEGLFKKAFDLYEPKTISHITINAEQAQEQIIKEIQNRINSPKHS